MPLSEFLNAPENTHAREELLNYRVLSDLKLAAAVRGYHLLTYYSDVDHDGFDIVLDDRDSLRKIQLKVVASTSATPNWNIHKAHLRPIPNNYEEFGFQYDVNWGVEGGVILMEYTVNGDNSISIIYRYTDIYVITAIALGLIRDHAGTKNAAIAVRDALKHGASQEQIGVSKGLFVKASSPAHLLCLMGMHSEVHIGWRIRVLALSSEEWGPAGNVLPDVLQGYRHDFVETMKTACGCDDF